MNANQRELIKIYIIISVHSRVFVVKKDSERTLRRVA